VLFVRPTRDLDRHCLRDGGDAVALADRAKALMRDFAKRHGAKGSCYTTSARSAARVSSATG